MKTSLTQMLKTASLLLLSAALIPAAQAAGDKPIGWTRTATRQLVPIYATVAPSAVAPVAAVTAPLAAREVSWIKMGSR